MAHISVLRSVRRFCLECQGGTSGVRTCPDTECPLRDWRLPRTASSADGAETADIPKTARELKPGKLSPASRCALRAVRRQCLLCAGSRQDVRACRARGDCALWAYRFGVTPDKFKAVRKRYFAPRLLSLLPAKQK